MKKNLLTMVLLFVIFVVGLTACAKQSVTPAPAPEPETKAVIESNAWMVFDKMPLKMDAERALTLGLRETALTEPVRVFNYMGTQNGKVRWQPETLPAGTKVLIGEDGIPLYKRDCFNKLFVPVTLEPVTVTPIVTPVTTGNDFWRVGKIIVLVILGLIFLILLWILNVIQRLARWLYEHSHRHDEPTTPPVPTARRIWMVHAEENTDHRTRVEYEGFSSFKFETKNEEVYIKASRR